MKNIIWYRKFINTLYQKHIAMTTFFCLMITCLIIDYDTFQTRTLTLEITDSKISIKPQTDNLYNKIPMYFEPNFGQADEQAKFISRGYNYNLFLTPEEAILTLSQPQKNKKQQELNSNGKRNYTNKTNHSAVLRMRLVDANPESKVIGIDKLVGRSNYLIGKNLENWKTNIPQYRKVFYQNIYHGIDMVYYGNQGRLEYDFIVKQNVDPSVIKLKFDGAQNIKIDNEGSLLLLTQAGKITHRSPQIYQEINGNEKQIEGKYELLADNQICFQVNEYNREYPLIIDPELIYSTYFGGSGDDKCQSITVDDSGYIYIGGYTDSPDFPDEDGTVSTSGEDDIFLSKLDSSGTELIYA